MKELKDRILTDGKALGTEILKLDGFLNHQVDTKLTAHIGEEFARIFKDSGVNKILTVEASGISVALATATVLDVPMMFAKKKAPNTMVDGYYSAPIRSFTKGTLSTICVSKSYLTDKDVVVIIDDFLATGEAAIGLLDLAKQAGAKVVGIGAVVEKKWQGGHRRLEELGYRVESLAVIERLDEGVIEFAE